MRIVFIIGFLWACATTQAQTLLPPVWQSDTQKEVQVSTRTIAYLPPTRIVWQETTGESSIQGLENLLLPGNGQADLFDGQITRIKNGATGKASFLLDFGRELQGGMQVVTGRSSKKEMKIRVRFGESVSEAMCYITP